MNEGRVAFGLTFAGFTSAVALVPLALWLPVYTSESSNGVVTHEPFVDAFGVGLLPFVIPAGIATAAWFALHRQCSHGGEIGRATRLNSSHANISHAVFCLKNKTRPD